MANFAIAVTEKLHSQAPPDATWVSVLPQALPFYIIAQYSLFVAWHGASHWMYAWVFFMIGNSILRVANVAFFAGGEIGNWVWVLSGVAVMLCGSVILKQGLA